MKEKLVLGATSLLKKCRNCKNGKNQHDLVLVLTVLSLPSCTGPETALSLILVKFRDVVDQKMLKIAQKCHFCGIKAAMGAAKVHHLL